MTETTKPLPRKVGYPDLGLYFEDDDPTVLYLHLGAVRIPWGEFRKGRSFFLPTFHHKKVVEDVLVKMVRRVFPEQNVRLKVSARLEYGYSGVRCWWV